MAIKINAAPASSNNSYTFSENGGVNATLNVRANDGKSSTRPLYSLDDGQAADLGTADPVSTAGTTLDRSALGAAIWINPDGTVGYSTAPIAAQVDRLAPGETLQDSFLYATRQPNGSLLWSTVRITITGTNDAPVATADVAEVVEDMLATGSAATNDSDVDNGAVLSFAATSSAAGFSMAADGSWTLDTSHEAYQGLAAGEEQQVVVTYKVTDQYGASATSTLTVTVTGTNDAPVAAAATAAALEDGNLLGRVAATDVDRGDSLTYALVGEAPAGLAFAADGSWSFDAGNAAYQGLGTGETRELVVNYSATDGAGASGMSTLTITVTGANDAPVALAADAAVTEDGIVTGQLAASDADDSAALTYTVAKGAPEGFVLAADGSWAFDANQAGLQGLAEGESAGIAVTYRVTDEHGASSLSTLLLTVTGANDAPVTTSHAADVTEGGTVSGQLTSIDQDNGAELSFAIVGDAPAGMVLAADGSWTFDAANQAYRGLAAGEIRIVEVPFAVTDEHGATASSFMVIAVTGTDDAPVLEGTPPELPAGTEDTAYTVTQEQLLAGWVDPDGSSLVATNLTAANASVTANADGSFTITPGAEFSGELQLSYEVTDGFRVSPASAQLTIAAVDDPASDFTGTTSGSLWEDVQSNSLSGDVNFTDRDGPADQWQPVTSTTRTESGFGFFTVAANGTWTYTLDNSHAAVDSLGGGQSLTDSFVIRTLDGTEQLITVLIKGRTDISYVAPGVSADADSWDNDDMFVGYEWSWARTYTAGPYDDQVQGSNFADTIQGGDGWDRIYGHDGNDLLYGDLASGTASWADDRVFGQRGDDTIYGGVGSDTLYGGSGDDIIYANGSATADRYESDVLFGGSGNDRLYGSANHDRFTGGTGADWLVGGGGSDWFQFQSATHTGDTIADFEQGRDLIVIESLRLDKANFLGALAGPGQVEAGQVGYFVADGQTTIYIDADGVPGADLEITLVGSYALNASDFLWS